jgi:regulator of sigma E protease
MFTAVVFLLILSFLVIIHELGHFITALWMKIKVEEFGLGYPPRAKVLFHWRGVPFTINWLPFGGFVKMLGEDGPSEVGKQEEEKQKHQATFQPFYLKSKKARLIVLLAGVVVNFIFGILAFTIVYAKLGIPTPVDKPLIGSVAEESPAAKAGILSGDVVISGQTIDGEKRTFSKSDQVVAYVNENLGETIRFEVLSNGATKEIEIYARNLDERPEGQGAIGISFEGVEFKHYVWWEMPFRSAWVGIQQSVGLSIMILSSFGAIFQQLFTRGSVPDAVAGPVGIVHQASKLGLFSEGWPTILNFAGMLSINLAILNVLPIPALDGGRAFFVLLEGFIGKKWRETLEARLNYVGFGFLLLLIVLITVKDIFVLVKDVFF